MIRDLMFGMTGDDVLALQKLLNAGGFVLAPSGAGAPGHETDFFGARTKAALAKYQAARGVAPSAGYFGPVTRAQMKAAGVPGVWW
jgi:peptidoglycan hydrolase-like protein with peptidoglycan-binding domain